MQFIYITDFHGDTDKYDHVCREAVKRGIKLIINGGDMCPHRGGKQFLTDFFPGWLERCKESGIANLGMFGNDDPMSNLPLLDDLVNRGLFTRFDGTELETEGWIFRGYNYVPDYPFALKDWVKLDYTGAPSPGYFGVPVESSGSGYRDIADIDRYFADKGTIAEELDSFSLSEPDKTIFITHSPPYGIGLDVCSDGREVGSKSIYNFIEKNQPVLSLHGHIHESPKVSGIWKTDIGRTVTCQPGRSPLLIDIEAVKIGVRYL